MQITNKPAKNQAHIFLESLIQQKFGVFLEVRHDQFPTPIRIPCSNKTIRARTVVFAYQNRDDAFINSTNPGTVRPVSMAIAECSERDQFVKRVGLYKALHRLHRNLAEMKKEEERKNTKTVS